MTISIHNFNFIFFEVVSFIFKLKDGKENITEDLEELKTLMNAFVFDVLGLQNIEENNNSKLTKHYKFN